MISFDVKNRWSGKIKFTAEIDCKEEESKNIKLGLAVKWAIRNNADLSSADLRYADLSSADLSSADLHYANLSSADLHYANLSSADLSSANLRYADLHYANLSYANLSSADLRYANLSYANLSSADLRYADLHYANLRYADLHYANLRYADLRYADLSSADLRYADLRYANLSYANLRSAKNAIIPITIGQCGNDIRTGYAIWDDIEKKVFVRLGCFYGEEKKAIDAVSKKYGSRSGYLMMVRAACKIAKERKVLNPTKETKK